MSGGLSILTSGAVHTREQAKIDAGRITQKARNELKGEMAASAAWGQSLSNRRRMQAAGRAVGEIGENMGRNLDVATNGRFMERLAASEEFGANVANAAAAGVGGSSVEMFNSTMRLSQALREEQGDRGLRTDLIASADARASAYEDGANSMDNQSFQAGLDYTQYVDHVKMSTGAKVLGFAAAAGATYFGGPKAGAAVLDLVDAQNRSANGDFDGAAARVGSAFQGAVGSFASYNQRGGSPWGKDLWASVRTSSGAVPQIGPDTSGLQYRLNNNLQQRRG